MTVDYFQKDAKQVSQVLLDKFNFALICQETLFLRILLTNCEEDQFIWKTSLNKQIRMLKKQQF